MSDRLRIFETASGFVFTVAIGFGVILIGANVVYLSYFRGGFPVICGAWLVASFVEFRFLYQFARVAERPQSSFGPSFAATHGRCPLLLRPIMATFWLAHFLIVIPLPVFAEIWFSDLNMTANQHFAQIALRFFVPLTAAYAANLYWAMMLSAIGAGAAFINRIWRFRILIDVLLAIVILKFPYRLMDDPRVQHQVFKFLRTYVLSGDWWMPINST